MIVVGISLPIKDKKCLLPGKSKDFYSNLNMKRISDIENFGKLSNQMTRFKDERIILGKGDKIATEEKDVVKKFKDHLDKIVDTLKIARPILSDLSDDPALNAIGNFSHHASVLKIKEARNSSDCFSFKLVTIEDICKEIRA